MALVVPSGGLISQVNGTVDGKVYYRGRWGETVRMWVNPTNTITTPRTDVRTNFATLMALFNSLTPDMQDDWSKAANALVKFNRLAQPYIPTGLQLFLERNMNLSSVGESPILLPEPDQYVPQHIIFSAGIFDTTHLRVSNAFNDNPLAVPVNYSLLYYGTLNQSAGRSFMTNRYRIIGHRSSGSGVNNDDLYGFWNVTYGIAPVTGKKIFFKAVLINTNTGQSSTPAFCNNIVA